MTGDAARYLVGIIFHSLRCKRTSPGNDAHANDERWLLMFILAWMHRLTRNIYLIKNEENAFVHTIPCDILYIEYSLQA